MNVQNCISNRIKERFQTMEFFACLQPHALIKMLHLQGYTCVMEGGKVNLLILPCGDSIKRLGHSMFF